MLFFLFSFYFLFFNRVAFGSQLHEGSKVCSPPPLSVFHPWPHLSTRQGGMTRVTVVLGLGGAAVGADRHCGPTSFG